MTKTQVEVITSVQRRRSWSRAEKERIIVAAMEPGAVASEVARAAGVHISQLFRWRQQQCERTHVPAAFNPVAIAPEPEAASAPPVAGKAEFFPLLREKFMLAGHFRPTPTEFIKAMRAFKWLLVTGVIMQLNAPMWAQQVDTQTPAVKTEANSQGGIERSEDTECFVANPKPGIILNKRRYFLSAEVFQAQENVEELIKQKYGPSARLAEWNEISQIANGLDYTKFADEIGLVVQKNRRECFNVFVTLNNISGPDDNRRYFVTRHNGVLPKQWYAIAQIGNNYIDLGRWTYPSQALVVVPVGRADVIDGTVAEISISPTHSGEPHLPKGAGSEAVPIFEDIKKDYFKRL